jgi:hypothetical protein
MSNNMYEAVEKKEDEKVQNKHALDFAHLL